MLFLSLTIFLFLLGTVASVASVDPNSIALNNLTPNLPSNDATGNSMTDSDAMASLSMPITDS